MLSVLPAADFSFAPAVREQQETRVAIERDLTNLEAPWLALASRAEGSAFQSHAWCRAWIDAAREAGRVERPCIATVWHRGRLVLLWPLAVRRLGPFRILQSLGEPATQYGDALVEPGDERARWLDLAWTRLRAVPGIDAIVLKGVRDDAAIAPLVASRAARFVTRRTTAPYCDFRPESRDGPVPRRSGRSLNALRRHQRNLGAHGAVTFTAVADAAARVAAIRDALWLKQAWLSRTRQVSAGYRHPANARFLEGLAARDDFLVLRLDVGGEIAAVEAGLKREGRYYSMVQSYAADHAQHGPGRLLFHHMIENAARLGIDVLDFLAPACRHKSEWANGAMPVQDYVIPTLPGGWLILAYVRHLRPRLKAGLTGARRLAKGFGGDRGATAP